ncbi:hypothetical protein Tco_1484176 [Tanacetum coccineum]
MNGRICNIKSVLKESKTSRHVKRGQDTKIPQSSGTPVKVGDEAVHKKLGGRMERAATTASSLEAEHDSDTILGDVDAQTRFETTSKQSNDPPLSRDQALDCLEEPLVSLLRNYPKFYISSVSSYVRFRQMDIPFVIPGFDLSVKEESGTKSNYFVFYRIGSALLALHQPNLDALVPHKPFWVLSQRESQQIDIH